MSVDAPTLPALPEWAPRFLEELAARGSITAAAKAVGTSRRTVFDWRSRNPEFAAQVEEARQVVLGEIETTLFEKAKSGDVAVMIYLGKSRLGWSDRPAPEDADLREQLEAMKGAIEDLDADTRRELLANYRSRRKPTLATTGEGS